MFTFTHNPGKTVVRFDGDPILTFVQEHVYFRGVRIHDLKLRPHGPVEMIELLPSAFFGHHFVRGEIQVEHAGPLAVRVILAPCKVDRDLLLYARERREFLIEYVPGKRRFRHTITVRLELLGDIHGDEGLHLNPMPQQAGDDYVAIEIDDPLLAGGVGPQVPMTQDWTGLPEPVLAEAPYTMAWTKRYRAVILPTVRRGLRRLAFNRIVNGVQQFYNRTLPLTVPGQPFIYEKADGAFVVFRPLFDHPASHHICEWGYDMHLYALLPRPAPGLVFRKGQRVELAYQFEELDRVEVPAGYLEAPEAEIEPGERAKADRPIYEEPCCAFTRSTLDSPDQYGWQPGERCEWNRSGGHAPGTGALEVRNGSTAAEAAWEFRHFGPSYACNPIPPASRFKVSAWVKADDPDKLAFSLTLNTFDGPALFSARHPVISTGAARDLRRKDGLWQLLEFVSQPSGTYTITGEMRFVYAGSGTAALSELRVERL